MSELNKTNAFLPILRLALIHQPDVIFPPGLIIDPGYFADVLQLVVQLGGGLLVLVEEEEGGDAGADQRDQHDD